ncbi:MAG: hypothetical protein U1F71_05270 [Verrucomicrobiaceae bacterium]
MKTSFVRSMLLGLAAFGGLALASCQAPSSAPHHAVTCDKCRTVHFMAPSVGAGPGNKGVLTLRHADSMSCPDCENHLVAMLKGGNLTKHTCKSCGGTLYHCMHH